MNLWGLGHVQEAVTSCLGKPALEPECQVQSQAALFLSSETFDKLLSLPVAQFSPL